jgi:hypothetical protein
MGDIGKTSDPADLGLAVFEDNGEHRHTNDHDRLQQAVHVALAIYLLPALILVLAIGGTLIAGLAVFRAVTAAARMLGGVRLAGVQISSNPGRTLGTVPTRRVNSPMAGRIVRPSRATSSGGRTGAERLN